MPISLWLPGLSAQLWGFAKCHPHLYLVLTQRFAPPAALNPYLGLLLLQMMKLWLEANDLTNPGGGTQAGLLQTTVRKETLPATATLSPHPLCNATETKTQKCASFFLNTLFEIFFTLALNLFSTF